MFNIPTLGGDVGIVYFGPRSRPRLHRYWAERGLIHFEDSETGEYKAIPRRLFLHRALAVSEMLGNSKSELAKSGFAHWDEVERQVKFIEQAGELARKAKEQGMPHEPDTIRERQVRAKKTFVVPALKSMF